MPHSCSRHAIAGRPIRRLLAQALCVFAVSCSSRHIDLPSGQIWTSAHFRYAARADDAEVCGGVVGKLESHLQAVTSYLGLAWGDDVIGYYKFRDRADFDENSVCPDAAIACAKPTPDVRSPRVLHGYPGLLHCEQ